MSCNRSASMIPAIILMTAVTISCVEDVLMKTLPASGYQTEVLAMEVCDDFFENDDEKADACAVEFSDTELRRNISEISTQIEIVCRSKEQIRFTVHTQPKVNHSVLVVLLSENDTEIINYVLVKNTTQIHTISVETPNNQSLWSTILNDDGTPTLWRRGPRVPPWKMKRDSKVIIEEPQFTFSKQNKVQITIEWKYLGATPCSNVMITNSCNKLALGKFFSKVIKAEDERRVSIDMLPLSDSCILQIHGEPSGRLAYRTPACDDQNGCMLQSTPPVSNIFLEATEDASNTWSISVHWSRLTRTPQRHNVTLRANGVHSVIIAGNITNVTFKNITSKGPQYNVSIETFYNNGRALTSQRGIFPILKSNSPSWTVITTGTWCVILMAAICVVAAVLWRRRRELQHGPMKFEGTDIKSSKEGSSELLPDSGTEDDWEVQSERLLLHEVIGEGAFGVVRRGTLAPGGKEVAVKMLKDFPSIDEIRSFRSEMELMKSVGAHPHVVSLVGCCSGRRPLIVAEYCSRGDLLSFLRCSWNVISTKRNAKYHNNNIESSDYRNSLLKNNLQAEYSKLVVNKLYDLEGVCDAELTSLDLLSFCRQIVKGMEFLASNRVVHRDLAARNILVSGDRTLKIADFGLSRDVYQDNQYKQKGNGKMPVKWMALESLTHRIYTTQSDVWSFGVVVWEVVTLGGAPYPEVPAARLPRLLRAGYRMPRPNNCSKQLYEVMQSCWRARPRDRPTFAELHAALDELLHSACADEYLSLEIDDQPPVPKQGYFKMLFGGNRAWSRTESYERPLKAPNSNHYTSPPASIVKV